MFPVAGQIIGLCRGVIRFQRCQDWLCDFTYADYPDDGTARTRITLSGTPAARPYISGLRMISSKVA